MWRSGSSKGPRWFAQGTVEFFWYRLLVSLDSHSLATHLCAVWTARLWEAACGSTQSGPDVVTTPGRDATRTADASDEEQSVLRCCVLAKFLGLLMFYPQARTLSTCHATMHIPDHH